MIKSEPSEYLAPARQEARFNAFRIWSQVLGLAVFLLGALVLAGWALEIPTLKSVLPDWVAMRANTALAFVLAGASLWLQTRACSSTGARVTQAAPGLPSLGRLLAYG